MTLAVMQPYLFPYLGYYQLVQAVDTFVFFDDVNYINKGWINRNNILQQDKPLRFTVPLSGASQNKLINEVELSEYRKWASGFARTIEMNYRKATHFTMVYGWLNEFLSNDFKGIGELASASVSEVARLLQLPVHFKYSGKLDYKNEEGQDGQAKVLSICRLLHADTYINPKNGVELYDKAKFEQENIKLHFIHMDNIEYPQHKAGTFVPNLSIIDVLMFNGVEETKNLLHKYSLN